MATLQWALVVYLLFLVARFFYHQTNPRVLKITIVAALAFLLATLHYKLHSDFSEKPRMETDVYILASKVGRMRAEKDFNSGMLRKIYFRGTNSIDKYTGTNFGPFQIWISRFNAVPYDISDSALQSELYEYNQVMQRKYRDSLNKTNAPAAK